MIVHIGYPKTGTTYLQQQVFPYFEGITYYTYKECGDIFDRVIHDTEIEYDILDDEYKFYPKNNELYSLESLSGKLFTGENAKRTARRLKGLGFKKIIITTRNRIDWLESIYRHYIMSGGTKSYYEFQLDRNLFRRYYLQTHILIQYYKDLFGWQNVLELDINFHDYKSILEKFVGAKLVNENMQPVQANKSPHYYALVLLRFINNFTNNHYHTSPLIPRWFTTWKFRYLFQKMNPFFYRTFVNKKFT